MNVLIVEDEPNYSDTLEMFIDELGYHVTGVAQDGNKAKKLFQNNRPDIVLMDINIKGNITGIELAKEFQSIQPTPIIFITSFDDKETFEKAKETAPHAYLIKPFDPGRLERCMELALQRAHSEDDKVFDEESNAVLAKDSFFVKERNRLVKVNINDIFWVEVDDKYTILHVEEKKYVLRQSLKYLCEKLDPSVFVQTHRSHIVNAAKIEDIDLQLSVVRINGNEIPLGKSYKDDLIKRLQML
ncbi:LytR/AlgR family response regulator transcription factor [Roseivirga echinicomitans]